MKTCWAVLFITEKTGSHPRGRPLGPAGGDGDARLCRARAPWRQRVRGGAGYNAVGTQRAGNYGTARCLRHPPSCTRTRTVTWPCPLAPQRRRLGAVGPSREGAETAPQASQPASRRCSPLQRVHVVGTELGGLGLCGLGAPSCLGTRQAPCSPTCLRPQRALGARYPGGEGSGWRRVWVDVSPRGGGGGGPASCAAQARPSCPGCRGCCLPGG